VCVCVCVCVRAHARAATTWATPPACRHIFSDPSSAVGHPFVLERVAESTHLDCICVFNKTVVESDKDFADKLLFMFSSRKVVPEINL
jgi:hypothetical protein